MEIITMKPNPGILQDAITRLTRHMLAKGFIQEAVHEYKNQDGSALYWRIRLKNPETGEKWIRPLVLDANKRFS